MTTTTILLGIALLGLAAVIFILLKKSGSSDSILLKQQVEYLQKNIEASTRLFQEKMDRLNTDLATQMTNNRGELTAGLQEANKIVQASQETVGQRLDNAARVVGEVQNRLGKMEEATRQVFEVGKSIATLQDILKAPKLRGNLGELFLGDLLAQVLPTDQYTLQYEFKSKDKVDAVIRSVHGLIPVDSKFPLENFTRILQSGNEEEKRAARKLFLGDVKKHIDKIAQKYILPAEGTLELALMYVPAENVYYEILIRQEDGEKDLIRYAQERKVYPVSPNSFYAYLQTIAIGFNGLKIEKRAHQIMNDLKTLSLDVGKLSESFRLVGRHLNNSRSAYDDAEKHMGKLGERITSLSAGEEDVLRLVEGGQE